MSFRDGTTVWSFNVHFVKDSGGDLWKYPRVEGSVNKWGFMVRVGWRWTAYSIHVSLGKTGI
jgi:hypothetical protein